MMEDGWRSALGLIALIFLVPYALSNRPPHRAALLVFFGASQFGPVHTNLKIPLVPPLDKLTLPALVMLLAVLATQSKAIARARLFTWVDGFILLGFVGSVMTAMTNTDPLTYGGWRLVHIPGLTLKDGLFNAIYDLYRVAFIFLIGRWLFRDPDHLRDLIRFIAILGVILVPIVLAEARLSPMSHRWVYGVSHFDFRQQLRWGGYRPVGFTPHGLAFAIVIFSGAMCALIQLKSKAGEVANMSAKSAFRILTVALVLCKSTGAILWAVMFFPLYHRWSPARVHKLSVVLALVVAIYPLLRATNNFPTEWLVEKMELISVDRSESLQFRFVNEELLLEKARKRLWFGWGTYGRNGVYHEEMGEEVSVPDGYWIVQMSIFGLFGYTMAFGLLLAPVWMAYRVRLRIGDPQLQLQFAGLAFLAVILAMELLPNGLFSNWCYLVAGALAGLSQSIRSHPEPWSRGPHQPGPSSLGDEPRLRSF